MTFNMGGAERFYIIKKNNMDINNSNYKQSRHHSNQQQNDNPLIINKIVTDISDIDYSVFLNTNYNTSSRFSNNNNFNNNNKIPH